MKKGKDKKERLRNKKEAISFWKSVDEEKGNKQRRRRREGDKEGPSPLKLQENRFLAVFQNKRKKNPTRTTKRWGLSLNLPTPPQKEKKQTKTNNTKNRTGGSCQNPLISSFFSFPLKKTRENTLRICISTNLKYQNWTKSLAVTLCEKFAYFLPFQIIS